MTDLPDSIPLAALPDNIPMNALPDSIPVGLPDSIPVSAPSYSEQLLAPDPNPEQPFFTGDPTTGIRQSAREFIRHNVGQIAADPDAAAHALPHIVASVGGFGAQVASNVANLTLGAGANIAEHRSLADQAQEGTDINKATTAWLSKNIFQENPKDDPTNPATHPAGAAAADLSAMGIPQMQDKGVEYVKNKWGTEASALTSMLTNIGLVVAAPLVKGVKDVASLHRDATRKAKIQEYLEKNAADRVTNMNDMVDHVIGAEDGRYASSRGLSPADEQSAMLSEAPLPGPQVSGMDVTDSNTAPHNLGEHLDVIANNPDATPAQRALADYYRNFTDTLGLDQVQVYTGDKSRYNRLPGDGPTDSIQVREGATDPNRTILHEANHAILSPTLDRYEAIKTDPLAIDKIADPVEQGLMQRSAAFDKVYEASKAQWIKEHADQPHANPLTDFQLPDRYGFKNLHEFATESLGRPEFQQTLRNLTADPATMQALGRAAPGSRIKNMFQVAYRAIKDLLLPDEKGAHRDFLDAAIDHTTGLIENMDARSRTKGLPVDRGAEVAKTLLTQHDKADELIQHGEVFSAAHTLRNLLRSSETVNEFKTRLSAQFEDPAWKQWVEQRAEQMWDPANRNKLIQTIGENMEYQKLNKIDQQNAGDPRSADEFIPQLIKEIGKGKLSKADEMKWDEGVTFLPANILKTMKKDSISGRLIAFFVDKTRDYETLGEQLLRQGKGYMDLVDNLSQADKNKKAAISSYYDNAMTGRNELLNAQLQWPTREMLQAKGYEPHVIDAYLKETKMVDFAMDLQNQARLKRGQERIVPIPGFMPHVHEGAYKVFIEFTDPAGGKRVSEVKGFNNRWSAIALVNDLEAGKWDNSAKNWTFRPSPDPETGKGWRLNKPDIIEDSMMENFQDHLNAHRNYTQLDPSIRAHMETMESRSLAGTLKSNLERSDVSGYLGEHGPTDNLAAKLGMSPTNAKMGKLYNNFLRAVVEDYKNTMFLKEVYEPMLNAQPMGLEHGSYYGQFMEGVRITTKYMRESAANFVGQNVNHMKWFDQDLVMTVTDQLGLSPNLAHDAVNNIRNYLSVVALRGNVMFYASNVIQPGMVLPILMYFNEERRNAGATQIANSMLSMSKVLKNRFEPSPVLQAGLQWARDTHVVDPMLDLQMIAPTRGTIMDKFNSATGGKLNPYIEGMGKETTFMIAYQHMLDSGLSIDNARTFAAHVVDLTMVNYGRRSRALMFQNYGLAGQMISPFAQFTQAYLGLMALMAKQAIQNPAKLRSYKAIGAASAFYWATAGVAGMPVINIYDGIQQTMQNIFPEWKMPTLQGLLMKAQMPQWMQAAGLSDSTGHLPEWAIRGPTNEATRLIPGMDRGVYASAPFGAPSATGGISTAAFPILDAIKDVALLSLKETGLGDPPTKVDWYKTGMPLVPQPVRPFATWAMQPPDSDIIGSTRSTEGLSRMQPADWRSQMILGRPSLDIQINSDKERNVKVQDAQDRVALKQLVQIGVNAQVRGGSEAAANNARQSAVDRQLVGNVQDYDKAVADAVIGQRTTARERDAGDMGQAAKNRMRNRWSMDRPNEP